MTIAIPKEGLTDTALENLQKIIANKQTLFQRAFRMDSTEIEITDEKQISHGFHTQWMEMRLQTTHNLSQGCVTWQEMQKGYHQGRPKRTMTNEKVCQVRK